MHRPVASVASVGWLACSVLACSSSSTIEPGADAAADTAAATDASDTSVAPDVADASALVDAPTDAAPDPCGALDGTWRRCAKNPLAKAGARHADGRYELSIGDPDVQRDDVAQLWRAWWSTGLATTYTAPDTTLAIKYAESTDGVAWTVQDEPVLVSHRSTIDWDYSKIETPTVLHVPTNPPDRRWLLYYAGGNDGVKTGPGYTWYQIGLAVSADGKVFTRLPAAESPYAGKTTPYANVEGLVLLGRDAFPGVAGVADGLVADPEIVRVGSTFHLFFSSLAVDASGSPLAFGVSHATSTDGIHWTAASGNPIAAINGSAGPSVVQLADGSFELFFYRDSDAEKATIPTTFNPMLGVWKSTSKDLSAWNAPGAAREIAWDGSLSYEKYGWIATGDMVVHGGEHRWYYVAFDADGAPSGWVAPTHSGYAPAVISLSMARRR